MRLDSAQLLGAGALLLFALMPAVVSPWIAGDFGIYFVYEVLGETNVMMLVSVTGTAVKMA